MKLVWQPQHFNIGGSMSMNDVKSLSHSKWRCKYHIVFAPKYRRQIIYGRIKADVGKILRDLCKRKNVEIIEAECYPDHIHMLVTILPLEKDPYRVRSNHPFYGWFDFVFLFIFCA